MYSQLAFLSALCLMSVSVSSFPDRPHYVQCLSSSECAKFECCVIGMGRFSIPTCKPYGDIGDTCRPNSKPGDLNVTYPDGVTVPLSNVYLTLCPCAFGLTCNGMTATCEDSIGELFNHLDNY